MNSNTGIVITAGFRGDSGLQNEDIPFAGVSATVTAGAGAGVAGPGSDIALSQPPCHTAKYIPIMVAYMQIRAKRDGADI